MRIALDLRPLHDAALNSPHGGLGGAGMYGLELTRHLMQAPQAADHDWSFLIYPEHVPARLADLVRSAPSGSRFRPVLRQRGLPRASRRLAHSRVGDLWTMIDGLALSVLCRAARIDVFHALDLGAVPWRPASAQIVYTVHDLWGLRTSFGWRRRLATHLAAWPARRADRVVVVSKDTARDVIDLLGIAPERVRVIYPGVNPAFVQPAPPDSASENERESGGFFLHTGVLRPRKNPDNVLAGVARALQDGLPEHTLVCVGPYQTAPGLTQALAATWCAAGGAPERLIMRGDVTDDELVNLYRRATALVFPSWHEGFGQTVAEALAVGTPVVTSYVASIPESAGDLAVYAEPGDPASIGAACVRAASDTAHRDRVRREGPPWIASQFTWPLASQEVLQMYAELEQRPC